MSRQTQTFLKQRLEEVGISPKSHFGQNFLIDLNLLDILVERAQLSPDDVVLEVGTGTGSLTGLMAPRVAQVVTVEVDRQMHQIASEELLDVANVEMLNVDALSGKNRLNPEVLDVVRRHLQAAPGRRLKLAANLPYNVATPILSNLLTEAPPLVPESMTVTIQKELADRIMAAPATKDYSALSIWMQCQCAVELVRVLPPTVFWPRPKVHSAIIHLAVDHARRDAIADREGFHALVRGLFCHRRKVLRGVLHNLFKDQLTKLEADMLLTDLELGETARAEELDVATMLRLHDALRERGLQVATT